MTRMATNRVRALLTLLASGSLLLVAYPVAPSPAAAAGATPWLAITSGVAHACAISREGAVYCWGDDSKGQLGYPPPPKPASPENPTPTAVPAPVSGQVFTAIAAGANHTCAITAQGQIFCWGASDVGQLGDGVEPTKGAPPYAAQPMPVAGPITSKTVTAVDAGGNSTCAVTADGAAYCWGANDVGQLGIGVVGAPARAPALVRSPKGLVVASVTVGSSHACLTATTLQSLCWGDNAFGQVGTGVAHRGGQGGQYLLPIALAPAFAGTQKVASISAGDAFTCAVTAAGAAWCWGRQIGGRLGNGYSGRNARSSVFAPTAVPLTPALTGRLLTQVSAGASNACVLDKQGSAVCWGANGVGQIGNDEAGTDRGIPPTLVAPGGIYDGSGIASISVGGDFVCAVEGKAQGRGAVCWGSNEGGQLGQGSYSATTAGRPRTVVPPAAATPSPSPTNSASPGPDQGGADGSSGTPWLSIVGFVAAGILLLGLIWWLVRRRRTPQPRRTPSI